MGKHKNFRNLNNFAKKPPKRFVKDPKLLDNQQMGNSFKTIQDYLDDEVELYFSKKRTDKAIRKDLERYPLLSKAAYIGCIRAVDDLISSGENINVQTSDGNSPLMIAVDKGEIHIAQKLLEKGANLKLTNKNGMNALMIAVCRNNSRVFSLLWNYVNKMDTHLLNQTNSDGYTLLTLSVERGLTEQAKLLASLPGISYDRQTHDGRSALMIAVTRGQLSIIESLLFSGSSPILEDKRGATPLCYALLRSQTEILNAMLSRLSESDHNTYVKRRIELLDSPRPKNYMDKVKFYKSVLFRVLLQIRMVLPNSLELLKRFKFFFGLMKCAQSHQFDSELIKLAFYLATCVMCDQNPRSHFVFEDLAEQFVEAKGPDFSLRIMLANRARDMSDVRGAAFLPIHACVVCPSGRSWLAENYVNILSFVEDFRVISPSMKFWVKDHSLKTSVMFKKFEEILKEVSLEHRSLKRNQQQADKALTQNKIKHYIEIANSKVLGKQKPTDAKVKVKEIKFNPSLASRSENSNCAPSCSVNNCHTGYADALKRNMNEPEADKIFNENSPEHMYSDKDISKSYMAHNDCTEQITENTYNEDMNLVNKQLECNLETNKILNTWTQQEGELSPIETKSDSIPPHQSKKSSSVHDRVIKLYNHYFKNSNGAKDCSERLLDIDKSFDSRDRMVLKSSSNSKLMDICKYVNFFQKGSTNKVDEKPTHESMPLLINETYCPELTSANERLHTENCYAETTVRPVSEILRQAKCMSSSSKLTKKSKDKGDKTKQECIPIATTRRSYCDVAKYKTEYRNFPDSEDFTIHKTEDNLKINEIYNSSTPKTESLSDSKNNGAKTVSTLREDCCKFNEKKDPRKISETMQGFVGAENYQNDKNCFKYYIYKGLTQSQKPTKDQRHLVGLDINDSNQKQNINANYDPSSSNSITLNHKSVTREYKDSSVNELKTNDLNLNRKLEFNSQQETKTICINLSEEVLHEAKEKVTVRKNNLETDGLYTDEKLTKCEDDDGKNLPRTFDLSDKCDTPEALRFVKRLKSIDKLNTSTSRRKDQLRNLSKHLALYRRLIFVDAKSNKSSLLPHNISLYNLSKKRIPLNRVGVLSTRRPKSLTKVNARRNPGHLNAVVRNVPKVLIHKFKHHKMEKLSKFYSAVNIELHRKTCRDEVFSKRRRIYIGEGSQIGFDEFELMDVRFYSHPGYQPQIINTEKQSKWSYLFRSFNSCVPLALHLLPSSPMLPDAINRIDISGEKAVYSTKSEHTLRDGAFGTYVGLHEDSGVPLTVREFLFPNAPSGDVIKSLSAMQQLKHPNIAKFHGAAVNIANSKLCCAQDLYEFSLPEFLKITKKMKSLTHVLFDCMPLIVQIIEGVKYLHNMHVIHGFLKPSNVLVTMDCKVKLADCFLLDLCPLVWGMQSVYITKRAIGVSVTNLSWRPTELISANNELGARQGVTFSSDVQMVGMLIYCIVSGGKHPFGSTDSECQQNIKQGFVKLGNSPLNIEVKDLLKRMLAKEQSKRPHINLIMRHPHFWTNERKFQFLVRVGKKIEFSGSKSMLEVENYKRSFVDIQNWALFVPECLRNYLCKTLERAVSNVSLDLLSFSVALHDQFEGMPLSVRNLILRPARFIQLCFPTLFMTVYNIDRCNFIIQHQSDINAL